MDDELRLPTLAFQGHHRDARRVCGDGGAVIPTDQMQAEIKPRRST